MLINREGFIVNPSEIDVVECIGELVTKYVVRLILDHGYRKEVIAEEEFEEIPNDNQIKWCLTKHKNASFAVVEEIYKLDDLPF